MNIECWTTKATNTHAEYVIFIATMITRTRLNITSHVQGLSFHFSRQKKNMKYLDNYSAVLLLLYVGSR
jgi:hypothetical protein